MNRPATRTSWRFGVPSGWTSRHTAWWVFAPPAVMVGLRWLLQLVNDREGVAPALPLVAVSTATGVMDLLWPAALAIAGLTVAGLLMRRAGWRRVMPLLGLVWLLLWLAGSGALLQRHLNRQGLFLQDAPAPASAPVTAWVLSRQVKPPSLRSLGGTELVLRVPGLVQPQRLLIDDARAQQLQVGDPLALQLAGGRFSGLFVTGWRVLPAAPS